MARPAAGESSSSDSDAAEEAAEASAGAHAAARRQVIFCTRTHSQLSQFVGELRRTRFAESLAVAALGSRQVAGLGPVALACLLARPPWVVPSGWLSVCDPCLPANSMQ